MTHFKDRFREMQALCDHLAEASVLILVLISLSIAAGLLFAYAQDYAFFSMQIHTHLDLDGLNDEEILEEILRLSGSICRFRDPGSNVKNFMQLPRNTLSKGGDCVNHVRVFVFLARSQGFKAHRLYVESKGRSHSVAEVYHSGKWRIVDPLLQQTYRAADGFIATFEHIHESPDIILTQTDCRKVRADPKLEQSCLRIASRMPNLFRDSLEFEAPTSTTKLFKDFVLILNYPLSLFYEGPYRPIFPYWLDDPRLIATYILVVQIGSLCTLYARAQIRAQSENQQQAHEIWVPFQASHRGNR